jgi:hypothetical protein
VLWSDFDSEMAKNDVDSASVLDSWYATLESYSENSAGTRTLGDFDLSVNTESNLPNLVLMTCNSAPTRRLVIVEAMEMNRLISKKRSFKFA